MSEPTPYSLTQHFSALIGRKAAFAQATLCVDGNVKQMYGIYNVLPHDLPIVVKAELPLLGSMAGAMVGLPDSAVREQLRKTPLEEVLRDAIHELLNVASTVVTSEGRAIFTKMVSEPAFVDGGAAEMFKKPDHRSYFNVTVDGYTGGKFAIFAKAAPIKTVNI
jgi:hypothetical protein